MKPKTLTKRQPMSDCKVNHKTRHDSNNLSGGQHVIYPRRKLFKLRGEQKKAVQNEQPIDNKESQSVISFTRLGSG